MSHKPTLRLDWCSHQAAKYAVEHWHYSRTMPVGKMVRVGVWEGDSFIGAIIFSRGGNRNLSKPYGLSQMECCELVRVALTRHSTPVSRCMAIALRMLRSANPGLRLVVSFADPDEGHHGGIYQAGGWVYSGTSSPVTSYILDGRRYHNRTCEVTSDWSPKRLIDKSKLTPHVSAGRYRYLYPLDAAMREQIAPLAKPYPKRARAVSIAADALAVHAGEGGSIPTTALQSGTEG